MNNKTRKTRNLSLVLVPILLATGCSEVPDKIQRDVYTRAEDCMRDWQQQDLCQQMPITDALEHSINTTGSPGGGVHPIYWGPAYTANDRAVIYNGTTVAPLSNNAMSRPVIVTPKSIPATQSSPGSARSVPRGGFGGAGRASSGGHSSGG
jgi:uncharacterized protein YgiB involved in biofilm formation